MVKVNVVSVPHGWILSKICDRCMNSGVPGIEYSRTELFPKGGVDINLYLDIYNCYTHPTDAFDIGLFTHLDKDSVSTLDKRWLGIDFMMHMSARYYDELSKIYPEKKMSIVYPFDVSGFSLKKPALGIFQRGGYPGKGNHFMKLFMSQEIAKSFKFVFVGTMWDEVVSIAKNNGVEVQVAGEDYSQYEALYKSVDYVLIPSLWEGGPMAIAEALAQGIPIISADVGWADKDFNVEHVFPPNSQEGLAEILFNIRQTLVSRREQVEDMNFKYMMNHVLEKYSLYKKGEL